MYAEVAGFGVEVVIELGLSNLHGCDSRVQPNTFDVRKQSTGVFGMEVSF